MLPVWSCANALNATSERHRVATIARIVEWWHRFIAAPFSKCGLGSGFYLWRFLADAKIKKTIDFEQVMHSRSGGGFKPPSIVVRFPDLFGDLLPRSLAKLSAN